jgi:glycerol-3-phosphate dehydrogenase subunit B
VKRVVVVGSGIAGTAAALAASTRSARVTLLLGRPGATVLASGALDRVPWETGGQERPIDRDARAILDALDAYALPDGDGDGEDDRGVVLATTAGLVRPARACDRALLDLSSMAGVVLVPRFDHPAWDGTTLARTWGDARWATEHGVTFASAPAQLTRFTDERALPDADIAARHDEPDRLSWLADRLAEALRALPRRPCAILLPAWLGIVRARARELTARVGLPCGEALTGAGGPSGLRFERARDRALGAARIEVLADRALRAARGPDGEWKVELESGDSIVADSVVLATGGFVGGGLEYSPAGSVLAAALPPAARPLARATLDAPVTLVARQHPVETPSSLSGSPPESHAWPYVEDSLLDHLGVSTEPTGHVAGAPDGLFAAGELVADRPRTWLDALEGGVRAGLSAAT